MQFWQYQPGIIWTYVMSCNFLCFNSHMFFLCSFLHISPKNIFAPGVTWIWSHYISLSEFQLIWPPQNPRDWNLEAPCDGHILLLLCWKTHLNSHKMLRNLWPWQESKTRKNCTFSKGSGRKLVKTCRGKIAREYCVYFRDAVPKVKTKPYKTAHLFMWERGCICLFIIFHHIRAKPELSKRVLET